MSRQKLTPLSNRNQRDGMFELNTDTRTLIQLNNDVSHVHSSISSQRTQWFTLKSAAIKSKYDNIINQHQRYANKYTPVSQILKTNTQIDDNNQTLEYTIMKLRQMNTQSKRKQLESKERLIHQEFITLVKHTFAFLREIGLETVLKENDKPWANLFILREAYEIFEFLTPPIQNRILLAFDINPENDEEKIYYETFISFRNLIVANLGRKHDQIKFLMKFFNPDNEENVYLSDVYSLFGQIADNIQYYQKIESDYRIKDLLMQNIQIGLQMTQQKNIISSKQLQNLFQNDVLKPSIMMSLIVNDI